MSAGKIVLCVAIGGLVFWLTGSIVVEIVTRLAIAAIVAVAIIWGAGITLEHSAVAIGRNNRAEVNVDITNHIHTTETSSVHNDKGTVQWKAKGRRRSNS